MHKFLLPTHCEHSKDQTTQSSVFAHTLTSFLKFIPPFKGLFRVWQQLWLLLLQDPRVLPALVTDPSQPETAALQRGAGHGTHLLPQPGAPEDLSVPDIDTAAPQQIQSLFINSFSCQHKTQKTSSWESPLVCSPLPSHSSHPELCFLLRPGWPSLPSQSKWVQQGDPTGGGKIAVKSVRGAGIIFGFLCGSFQS